MLNQIQEDSFVVDVAITSTVAAGDVVIDNNIVGVAINGGASGDTISIILAGIVQLSADNGTEFTVGVPLYWTGAQLVLTGEGNTFVGTCVTAKPTTTAVANVMLNGINDPTAAGVSVSVFTGSHTTAGGAVTETITLTGVTTADIAFAQLSAVGASAVTITSVVTEADGISITFSADPSTDHVVSYDVKRLT